MERIKLPLSLKKKKKCKVSIWLVIGVKLRPDFYPQRKTIRFPSGR